MVQRSDTELVILSVRYSTNLHPGNVTQQDQAYGIELKHVSVEDHGTWTVSIATDTDPIQLNTTQFEVIVAKAPREVVFEGAQFQVSFTSLLSLV